MNFSSCTKAVVLLILASAVLPLSGQLVINEISANPDGRTPSLGIRETMLDHAPTYSEWVELKNISGADVSLDGLALTDDEDSPAKWLFPTGISLEPGEFLVVLADGLDGTGDYIHTNFGLASSGEYLGIHDASGAVIDSWEYPRQFPSHAYGREPGGTSLKYLAEATPGEENSGDTFQDYARAPDFSLPGGFYEGTVTISISTITAGANIHYTLNGDEPTESSPAYSGPITSTPGESLVLRARAFHSDLVPSRIESASYLIDQPAALKAIPVLSFVGGEQEVFYAPGGIIDNSKDQDREREREASMEFFKPDNTGYEQMNVGLRAPGHIRIDPSDFSYNDPWEHPWGRPQFNVFFRGEYGGSRFESPDLFPLSSITSFKNLRIRGDITSKKIYAIDEFVRRTFINTGNVGASGALVSLYINGKFKSLMNPVERVREQWLQEVYDTESLWDVKHVYSWPNGDSDYHGDMEDYFEDNDFTQLSTYETAQSYLDPVNFADYLLVLSYLCTDDWPGNNKILASERIGGAFRYFVWDSEQSIGLGHPLAYDMFQNELLTDNNDIPRFFSKYYESPEFKLLWADRAYKHFFHGGPLSAEAMDALWTEMHNGIRPVMAYMYGEDFDEDDEGVEFEGFRDTRRPIYFDHMRAHGLWPDTEAPTFNQRGGDVDASFEITLTNPNDDGVIYYSTDGSDPRAPGGAVAANAETYNGPITLGQSSVISARVLQGSEWSPLNAPAFAVAATIPSLRVTELMYHPSEPSATEVAAGFVDQDQFEFIEFQNVGGTPIDLSLLQFTDGITFNFSTATESMLAPGAFALIVSDRLAFEQRYGTELPVIGDYSGSNLRNSGEVVAIQWSSGSLVQAFEFSDDWYPSTDGAGFSLEIIDPSGALVSWNDAASWRPSNEPGGSPAVLLSSVDLPELGSVVINEVLTHSDEPEGDWIELHNTTGEPIAIGGWYLSDDLGTQQKYQIADGTEIPGGGFIRFTTRDHFGDDSTDPGALVPFGLSEAGEEVVLSSALAGVPSGYLISEDFDGADNGVTFGRHLLSTGKAVFTTLATPTPAAANSGPRVGEVVIHEIHYHPQVKYEYIELFNTSASAIQLYDPANPANTWRMDSGVAFTFPPNTVLDGGAQILLVSFDPETQPIDLANFIAAYQVPAHVEIMGPYQGSLSNDGERLTLSRPGAPDPLPPHTIPFIVEDTVRYNDAAPWPVEPDGSGPSLGRVDVLVIGDEPSNWVSVAGGSAGAEASVPASVYFTWLDTHFSEAELNNPALEEGLWGASADPDLDGFGVLLEHYMGMDPRTHSSEAVLSGEPSESGYVLYFRRAKDLDGSLSMRVMVSQDQLNSWGEVPATLTIEEDHETWELVKAELNVDPTQSRLFFQLEVSRSL